MGIHEGFIIYLTKEFFYIQPVNSKQDELMVIDRFLNQSRLTTLAELGSIPSDSSRKSIYGLVGTIKLLGGYYLIVITSKSKVGTINDQDIWKVERFEMIPYHDNNDSHMQEDEKRFNNNYKSMIEYILGAENFYFSYTYDITHTLQRLQNTTPDFYSSPLIDRVDERFVWNYYLLQNFNAPRELFSNFFLPLMLGFASINTIDINGKKFDFAILSRRSCQNAGTRFNVRGADENGNVANFVESEQLVSYSNLIYSYVQIRGSMPMFWTQKPNLKYKPAVTVDQTRNHLEACRQHFNRLLGIYGKQVCVNLVNQHGSEGALEKLYSDLVRSINDPSVKYESFDFHKQCSKERYDRLSILTNRLATDQDAFGYFAMNKEGKNVLQVQKGVFRVNCIDCLDRTNVVQGLLAKRILQAQLQKLNILGENESVETYESLYNKFRHVWADNGDILSIQYAGTGALKSDFTRTGKRTTYGLMRDGSNSLYRYFINNFYDGFKQDAIDLFLGNYRVSSSELDPPVTCPIAVNTDKKFLTLPAIGLGTFSMFIISLLVPAETYQEQLGYVFFWGFATFCTLGIMFYYGKEIVDTPKLVHRKAKKE